MKYLLDTHTAMWALGETSKLSASAKSITDDTSNSLYVSIVSAWEIAVKLSLGKLKFHGGSKHFLSKMKESGIDLLGVDGRYLQIVEELPFHHRDPFDRLLIATAIANNMTILTADEDIRRYDVGCAW